MNSQITSKGSSSIVITTLDCGLGGSWFKSWVGLNILWGSIDCAGLTRAFIPLGRTSAPEQLNIKTITGVCTKSIDGWSLEQSLAIVSVASSGICHSNSNAWLYRDGETDHESISYITLLHKPYKFSSSVISRTKPVVSLISFIRRIIATHQHSSFD